MNLTRIVLLSFLAFPGPPAHAHVDSVTALYERTGVQGGLIVELGLVDVEFTAALAKPDTVTLHTLSSDPQRVARARQELASRGLSGKITIDAFDGETLPYADNLVNLVVLHDVRDNDGRLAVSRAEILRVLAPGGVLCRRESGSSTEFQIVRKPWPPEIDHWTHFLHSAAGNAVAADRRVAAATALQWIADPKYCRSHEIDSSLPAMVSADGRLIYILDEGPIGVTDPRFPARWMLIARDAFNGVLLWKRPLESWGWQEWKPEIRDADWRTLRGQRGRYPSEVPRRLVAVGDRVYVTLGFRDAPLSILDAATGDELVQCEDTEGTQEIVVDDNTIFARVRSSMANQAERRGQRSPRS